MSFGDPAGMSAADSRPRRPGLVGMILGLVSLNYQVLALPAAGLICPALDCLEFQALLLFPQLLIALGALGMGSLSMRRELPRPDRTFAVVAIVLGALGVAWWALTSLPF